MADTFLVSGDCFNALRFPGWKLNLWEIVASSPFFFLPLTLASPLGCSCVTSRDFPKWRACSQGRSEPPTSHSRQTGAHPIELKQGSVKLSMCLRYVPMDVLQVKFKFG